MQWERQPAAQVMSEDQQPVPLIQIVSSDYLEMQMERATSGVGDVRGPVSGLYYQNSFFRLFGYAMGWRRQPAAQVML